MRRALISALALVAACSDQPADTAKPASGKVPAPQRTGPDRAADAVEGRSHRYTSLTGCKKVREEREEMPYTETKCPGPAGWALRIADSDARQTLAVIAPDGGETPLDLSQVSGGGFSSFGKTAEWRGPSREPFVPDSLIVRFQVAERPYPEPETAYLIVSRLSERSCVVAKVAPGPDQNERARKAADNKDRCVSPN